MTDFKSFEFISGNRDKGMVILGDHAMRNLPERYGRLGLPETAFSRHIAYDIGIESLCRKLSARLGVPSVLGGFSRLLIDPNRGEDDPTLIMKISDGAIVPGNHPITDEEWERRLETYHRPYHNAVDTVLTRTVETSGKAPLVFSLHSYTPFWKSVPRPWHAAVLWDTDHRAVHPLNQTTRRGARLGAGGALGVGDHVLLDPIQFLIGEPERAGLLKVRRDRFQRRLPLFRTRAR